MPQSINPNASDETKSNEPWQNGQALELWKYFGGVGAADKNTMVTVVSWLLGLSVGIIGYIGTNLLDFQGYSVREPLKAIILAVLGVSISGVAGFVSLLYAGYSNWNWAQADAIARELAKHNVKWSELLPENSEAILQKWTGGKLSFYAFVMNLGKPCEPTKKLVPIFWIYIFFALFAILAHLVIFVLSVWR